MSEFNLQTKKTLFIVIAILVAISAVFAVLWFSNSSTDPSSDSSSDFSSVSGDVQIRKSTDELNIEQARGDFSAFVSEEYLLEDSNGNPIDISGEDVIATIKYAGDDDFYPLRTRTHQDLLDDSPDAIEERSVFFMNVWPALNEGKHVIRVEKKDGTVYEADFYWLGTTELSAGLQEQTEEGSRFLIGEEGIAEFQRMLHIHPSGSAEELSPRGESALLLDRGLEEGEHVFLIKQNDAWHYAVINNPEDF